MAAYLRIRSRGYDELVARQPENPLQAVSVGETDPFRDPTSRSISHQLSNGGMEPAPTCRTCGALVDLTRRNAVTSVIYRHVMCRGCGVICILEGPERNVNPRHATEEKAA